VVNEWVSSAFGLGRNWSLMRSNDFSKSTAAAIKNVRIRPPIS
jgi:hypothetical protein